MKKSSILIIVFVLVATLGNTAHSESPSLDVVEFKKLYTSLLAGKTLVTESTEGEQIIKKEKHFGSAIDVGHGDFEIFTYNVVSYIVDGDIDRKITIKIIDRIHDIGGAALIYEEVKHTLVDQYSGTPLEADEPEFVGMFRVGANKKGGFDIQNFGLTPTLLREDDKLELAGSMILFSCFPDKGKTKCTLTIRDYNLGGYESLVGYDIGEPAGGDLVEHWVEMPNASKQTKRESVN